MWWKRDVKILFDYAFIISQASSRYSHLQTPCVCTLSLFKKVNKIVRNKHIHQNTKCKQKHTSKRIIGQKS